MAGMRNAQLFKLVSGQWAMAKFHYCLLQHSGLAHSVVGV